MDQRSIFFVCMAMVSLAGCSHPIKVAPDITKIEQAKNMNARVTASVAYYIPLELDSLEVTTPAGGGDVVRYYPYRDIETGFAKMLSNIFSSVMKLAAPPDFSKDNLQRLDYIINPQLATSSGSGFFTWPPTNFSVDLTANFRDATGNLVASPRVIGVGTAATGEGVYEHGIAGRRAMEDALLKMQAAIQEQKLGAKAADPDRKPSHPQPESNATTRLTHLKDLKERGLISEGEYNAKRKEILDSL